MAVAQILIYVVRPTDVSADDFQAAVSLAAQGTSLIPERWTYAVTAVTVAGGIVTGGPFNGYDLGADANGRYTLSAFRQNVRSSTDNIGAQTTAVVEAIRPRLAPSVSIRTAFRLPRSAIFFDKGVPGAIPLVGEGGADSSSIGLLAVLGIATIAMVAYGKSKPTALRGLSVTESTPWGRSKSREITRAKAALRGRGNMSRSWARFVLQRAGYSPKQISRMAS